jgi:hypothetical protein
MREGADGRKGEGGRERGRRRMWGRKERSGRKERLPKIFGNRSKKKKFKIDLYHTIQYIMYYSVHKYLLFCSAARISGLTSWNAMGTDRPTSPRREDMLGIINAISSILRTSPTKKSVNCIRTSCGKNGNKNIKFSIL